MREIIFVVTVFVAGLAGAAKADVNDLVGGTFKCLTTTYTFFPNNKYTGVVHFMNIGRKMNTISYTYEGGKLTLRYIGVNGKRRELSYKATYIAKKGKLILEGDERQEICTER